MFVILQFGVMALAALLLLYLFEQTRNLQEKGEDQPSTGKSDPSDAEVVEGGTAKPVNRIKKYRF